MTEPAAADLRAFEAGDIDPAGFTHREHVRMGFEMMRSSPFIEAARRFSLGIQRMAARAGKPEAYHETITIAFLAIIGERMTVRGCADFEAFEAANPDLFDKGLLRRWYDADRLNAPIARARFVLPRARRPLAQT